MNQRAVPAEIISARQRIVVAITGASGAVYGVHLLRRLRAMEIVECHLVVSDAGRTNLRQETGMDLADLSDLAHQLHDVRNVAASLASGSFQCRAMVVAPCSMRTLAAIAHGLSDNLVTRAADVMLKERRPLVLMVRESPLHLGHLRNMVGVTEMGAIVCPPMPAFYLQPGSLDDIVDFSVARVLDLIGLPQAQPRWQGLDGADATAHSGQVGL